MTALDKIASDCITRTIERLRALPDYAGRPSWDKIVAEEMEAAFQARTDAHPVTVEISYKSIFSLRELLRETGLDDPEFATLHFKILPKIFATPHERRVRSATFMVALCDLMETEDPLQTFCDVFTELNYAAVQFGWKKQTENPDLQLSNFNKDKEP